MIFPHFCIGCSEEGELLCEKCFQKLCGELCVQEQMLRIEQHNAPKSLTVRAITFGSYEHELLRTLMQKYKYEGLREVGQRITAMFAHVLQQHRQNIFSAITHGSLVQDELSCVEKPPLIIPMPLHPLKQRMRGFNQTEPLALIAAHFIGGELSTTILKKRYMWHAQATITNHADRVKNIQNTFYVAKNADKILSGRTVILVDDVLTTGATVIEAVQMLVKAGADNVTAIAFLRG